MASLDMQRNIKQYVLEAIRTDPRIIGCVDYGSTSEGRSDAWSDLDIALFIEDSEFESFIKDWKQWASQFGHLLLAYIGGVGHPWVVYDMDPVPLRVDFAFHPASTLNRVLKWPNSPTSTAAMVWHDRTDGKLTAFVSQLVGQSLAPNDLAQTFEQVCGDFWYYFLRTHAKLTRGENWAARYDFNSIITGNLFALLRIESGAIDRWRGSSASVGIEKVLSEKRRTQLNQCIPGPSETDLRFAIFQAGSLGYEASEQIAQKYSWDWPISLANKVLRMYR